MLSKRMNSLMLIEMIAYSELMKRKSTDLMATKAMMEVMEVMVAMVAMAVMAVMTVTVVTETVKQLKN